METFVVKMEMIKVFGIMVGIPQSGKSTACGYLRDKGWTIINPDTYRKVYSGKNITLLSPEDERVIWKCVEISISALLRTGHHVILDATNVRKIGRLKWKEFANKEDVQFIIFSVNTDTITCIKRNEHNLRFLDEKGDVTDKVILDMARKYDIPTKDEGEICEIIFDKDGNINIDKRYLLR